MEYATLVLFVTNLWIFSYRFFLNLLNQNFPPRTSLDFLVKGVAPEPFEIPLFVILIGIFVLLIYFATQKLLIKRLKKLFKRYPHLGVLALGFLSLLFILQLGGYPLSQSKEGLAFITPFMRSTSLFVVFAYLLGIVFVILLLKRIVSQKGRKERVIYFSVAFIIAFLVFEPGFPVSWLDYSYFIGPITEIAGGKMLYGEGQSLYGFVSVISLGLLNRIGVFSVSYLPFTVYLFYVTQYFISFYLIYRLGKSLELALVGLFSIITINYFSLTLPPISTPQVGAMRWLPLILSLFIFYRLRKIDSRVLIFSIAALSLIEFDTGIYLLLSYLSTLAFFTLKKLVSLRSALASFLFLILSLGILFLSLDLLVVALGYSHIDLRPAFAKLHQYYQGFNMIGIPTFTYFWIVVLIYFASVFYYFSRKRHSLQSQVIIFSANLAIFGSFYYLGRSHPSNLLFISILPLLNLFLLLSPLAKKLSGAARLLLITFVFLLTIFLPAYNRRVSLGYIVYQKLNRIGLRLFEESLPKDLIYHFCEPKEVHLIKSEMDECLNLRYQEEILFINNNLADEEVVIISPDDTYLFYLTGKKNMLYANPQSNILTKQEADFVLRRAIVLCPKRIVVDPRVFKPDSNFSTLNFVYTVQPYLFEKLQQGCNFKYDTLECTEKICIAEN